MLSGDAHMLAIDDGTHSNYVLTGSGGIARFSNQVGHPTPQRPDTRQVAIVEHL